MKLVIVLLVVVAVAAVVMKLRSDAKRDREAVMARLSDDPEVAAAVSPTEALFREAGVPVPEAMRVGLVGAPPPPPPPGPLQSAIGVINKVLPSGSAGPSPAPASVAAATADPAASVAAATEAPAASVAAATEAPSTPGDPASAHRTDLSDLFAGIEMPCDLVPLSMVGGRGVNCAVATFTTEAGRRPELAGALGAELVRLGCEVSWVDHATALARRGADSAVVRIYDRPSDLTGPDGAPAHPDVGDDRVLVSLTAT